MQKKNGEHSKNCNLPNIMKDYDFNYDPDTQQFMTKEMNKKRYKQILRAIDQCKELETELKQQAKEKRIPIHDQETTQQSLQPEKLKNVEFIQDSEEIEKESEYDENLQSNLKMKIDTEEVSISDNTRNVAEPKMKYIKSNTLENYKDQSISNYFSQDIKEELRITR